MGILREEWRTVVNDSNYEVSSLGRVRRLASSHRRKAGKPSPAFLATNLTALGYPRVSLGQSGSRRAFHIHRLVADAFLGTRPAGMEVNHIDGNKENAEVTNLEYVTRSENAVHACETGLKPAPTGEKNPRAKLTEENVLEILSLEGTMRQVDIAEKFGITQVLVGQIFRGLAWSYLTGRIYQGPIRNRRGVRTA